MLPWKFLRPITLVRAPMFLVPTVIIAQYAYQHSEIICFRRTIGQSHRLFIDVHELIVNMRYNRFMFSELK